MTAGCGSVTGWVGRDDPPPIESPLTTQHVKKNSEMDESKVQKGEISRLKLPCRLSCGSVRKKRMGPRNKATSGPGGVVEKVDYRVRSEFRRVKRMKWVKARRTCTKSPGWTGTCSLPTQAFHNVEGQSRGRSRPATLAPHKHVMAAPFIDSSHSKCRVRGKN